MAVQVVVEDSTNGWTDHAVAGQHQDGLPDVAERAHVVWRRLLRLLTLEVSGSVDDRPIGVVDVPPGVRGWYRSRRWALLFSQ